MWFNSSITNKRQLWEIAKWNIRFQTQKISIPTREKYGMNNTEPIKNQETYNLDKFPKELKKKIYQGFEPRFTIVLLSSLFLHMALALFLSTHLSKKKQIKFCWKGT